MAIHVCDCDKKYLEMHLILVTAFFFLLMNLTITEKLEKALCCSALYHC